MSSVVAQVLAANGFLERYATVVVDVDDDERRGELVLADDVLATREQLDAFFDEVACSRSALLLACAPWRRRLPVATLCCALELEPVPTLVLVLWAHELECAYASLGRASVDELELLMLYADMRETPMCLTHALRRATTATPYRVCVRVAAADGDVDADTYVALERELIEAPSAEEARALADARLEARGYDQPFVRAVYLDEMRHRIGAQYEMFFSHTPLAPPLYRPMGGFHCDVHADPMTNSVSTRFTLIMSLERLPAKFLRALRTASVAVSVACTPETGLRLFSVSEVSCRRLGPRLYVHEFVYVFETRLEDDLAT
jgi:hypothetical protein